MSGSERSERGRAIARQELKIPAKFFFSCLAAACLIFSGCKRAKFDGAKAMAETERDRRVVLRARKLQRYLTQPFHLAAEHSGIPGVSVRLAQTLADCDAFLSGHYDGLSEEACYMRGAMSEAS